MGSRVGPNVKSVQPPHPRLECDGAACNLRWTSLVKRKPLANLQPIDRADEFCSEQEDGNGN